MRVLKTVRGLRIRPSISTMAVGALVILHAGSIPLHAAPMADDIPGQADAARDIAITDPSLQPFPGHNDIALGYFVIENKGGENHLINGIQSPLCARIIARHTAQESNERTDGLFTHFALPRHTRMVFGVGGYHFVCQGFEPDHSNGQVPVTFSFLGGTQQTISFPVQGAASGN